MGAVEKFLNAEGPAAEGPYPCPCCGFITLTERSAYEICPVCFWEDDGQDDHDADEVRGGPNRALSLTVARANFQAMGACGERASKISEPLNDPGTGRESTEASDGRTPARRGCRPGRPEPNRFPS